MITQEFNLNMIPDSEPVVVHINQYDEGQGRFIAHLYNGDVAYTPASGATAVIQGTKPDGRGFDYNASLSGSTVTANVTDQMSIVAGIVRCQIIIQEGNNVTGTFVFQMDVQKSALPANTDMSASEYQVVMELIQTAQAISANPPIIGENGNWWIWDVDNKQYKDSGIDASITVQIADVTMIGTNDDPYVTNTGTDTDPIFHLYIPEGKGIASIQKTSTVGLVDTYTVTYTDNTTYTFTVTNGKTAYQSAVDGGYDRTEAEFNDELANFADYADNAKDAAENAEAYAVGTRNGTPVGSTDDTYHNNSKYYSAISGSFMHMAGESATAAASSESNSEAWAVGQRGGVDVPSSDETYHNNSKYYSAMSGSFMHMAGESATAAALSETNAATSETNAATSESNSEAWAVGQRGGVDVPSSDETYHNNSKYYSAMSGSFMHMAGESATAAALSESNAADSEENSEAWAVGTKNGQPVPSTSPQYNNSAKFWAEQAAQIVNVEPMDNDTMGIGKPDGTTTEATNGVFSAIGTTIIGTIDPTATEYGANWLKDSNNHTIVPDTRKQYRVQRNNKAMLYYWTGTAYELLSGGGGGSDIKLSDVSGAAAAIVAGTARVTLTWTDPNDVEVSGVKLAEWAGTKVVRKVGSAPTDQNDGTVIVDEQTRNQYSSSGFADNSVSFGTTYYYRFFPYTTTGLYTDGSSVSATPAMELVSVPIPTGDLTYDGTEQTMTFDYDSTKVSISGDKATTAGTHTATAHLLDSTSYSWSDGTTADKSVEWVIKKAKVTAPTVTGAFTYDGTQKTATVSAYDSNIISVTGLTGTNAGSYTATMSLIDSNYEWSDGTTADKTETWTIAKAKLIPPTITGSFTYDGTQKTASVSTYDSTKISVTGLTGTDAGTYTATMSLLDDDNYAWTDDTTADKTETWTIAKAAGNCTLSKNSVTLDPNNLSDTVTVSNATGTVSVSSASPSDVSAVLSGDTITLTAESEESKTVNVTVSIAGTSNYEAATKTIAVELAFVSELDATTWAQISAASAAGTASSLWSVGDCKKIRLNGTVGTLSLSNVDLYVFILGFNHNSAVEGSGISFGCFKTAKTGGKDVCLCDSNYNSNKSDGTKTFNMNHWGGSSSPYNTNYGGWKGCDARYDILGSTKQAPSGYGSTPTTSRAGYDAASNTATSPVSNTLMAALPSDLRAVMKPITKYTDNKGNSSNTAANVTSSVDYLPLLSEFEVQGARTYANEYEKNSQKQYAYYANGNSKVKYRHDSTGSAAGWWCRSATSSGAATFCRVTTDGGANGSNSRTSGGLAPAFLV